jgi:NAD(P)-dependent dehydrogenase (short-subunit alcohol dehydrogenase family)
MVSIVTGGSKGIGLAIARALLDRDGQVASAPRGDLQKAAQTLGAGRGRVLAVRPMRGSRTPPRGRERDRPAVRRRRS